MRRVRDLVSARLLQWASGNSESTIENGPTRAVIDGIQAALTVEGGVAQVVVSSRELSDELAEFRSASRKNIFGESSQLIEARDSSAALAVANGLALSGLRVSAVVRVGPGNAAVRHVFAAVERQLPVVVVWLEQDVAGCADALGDCGCVVLRPTNVQDVVDCCLVGRRVAEASLLPVIVAVEPALLRELQDVGFPSRPSVREYLGAASDRVESGSAAEKIQFGARRDRVPRSHDLDQPVLVSPDYGKDAARVHEAGQGAYRALRVEPALEKSIAGFERIVGRRVSALATSEMAGAKTVVVTVGASFELAATVAEALRKQRRAKVGVVGVRCQRPWGGTSIVELVRGRTEIVVLEPGGFALGTAGPLTAQLREALGRALGRRGKGVRLSQKDLPALRTVVVGTTGGLARTVDFEETLTSELARSREVVQLGVAFASKDSSYPKRQELGERLRLSEPELEGAGVRAPRGKVGAVELRDEGFVVACLREPDQSSELFSAVTNVLGQLVDGRIRALAGATLPGTVLVEDRIAVGPAAMASGGVGLADIVVVDSSVVPESGQLRDEAVILLVPRAGVGTEGPTLSEAFQSECRRRHALVYTVAGLSGEWLCREAALGAVFALLLQRRLLDSTFPRVMAARGFAFAGIEPTGRAEAESALLHGKEALRELATVQVPIAVHPERRSGVPRSIRQLSGPNQPPRACLADFHAQIGVLYQDNVAHELSADPLVAGGVIPPLSAALGSTQPRELPRFDATTCTGCGQCYSHCPDGAFGPTVLGVKQLLEAGIQIAAEGNPDAGSLRMLVGKLAAEISSAFKNAQLPPKRFETLARPAFEHLVNKAGLDAGRMGVMRGAFESLMLPIGGLQAARTEPFFRAMELDRPGHGEVFVLAVNPDSCKGCGLCVSICEPNALQMVPVADCDVSEMRAGYELWERLPDTSGRTIASAMPMIGRLPAMMLSRHASMGMFGADSVEPGSTAKLALRQVMAIAESQLQRRALEQLEAVEGLADRVATCIRDTLAAALPSEDISALARGLDELGSTSASISELSAKVELIVGRRAVDVPTLERLAQLGQQLGDLAFKLRRGTHGLGRARLGLLIHPTDVISGLCDFPDNVFSVPVSVDRSEESIEVACGLAVGQMQQLLGAVGVTRAAELTLTNPVEAKLREGELRALRFAELADDEQRYCAPTLAIGGTGAFSLDSLQALASSALPVKVVLFAEFGVSNADLSIVQLLGLGAQGAFVAQCCAGAEEQFAEAVARMFAFEGPGILQIAVTSPRQHGIPTDASLKIAADAVSSRVVPVMSFDPAKTGVFGQRIEMATNPSLACDLHCDELGTSRSPLDWAHAQGRFAAEFVKPGEQAPNPVGFIEWATMPPCQRAEVPVLLTSGAFMVSRTLQDWAIGRLMDWRILQELSGLATPFTARVERDAASSVAQTHASELQLLRERHAAALASVAHSAVDDAVKRVRERLLALAGYSGDSTGGDV